MADQAIVLNILLVDDEETILLSLKRSLIKQGYGVYTATNGEEGLQQLEAQLIDIVISDLKMPGMDGADFLKVVFERWPNTIRMLLTGQPDMERTIQAINEGKIYSYILKPWDENDLQITLKNAVEKSRVEAENRHMQTVIQQQNESLKELNKSLEDKIAHRTSDLSQAIRVAEESYQALKENYLGIIRVFSELVETRGHIAKESGKRIAESAKKLITLLNLPTEEEQPILFASFLYHIGAMVLPDHIINRPFATLNNEEKIIFKSAAVKSSEILSGLKALKKTALYIRHMHERFDGKGYPDGLSGEKIPIGSRVLTIVADYENLQNGTLTGKKHDKAQAIKFLLDNRNSRYDPNFVNLFIEGQSSKETPLSETTEEKSASALTSHAAPTPPAVSNIPTTNKKKIQMISSDQLTPGMTLAKDLQTKAGIGILSKGFALEEETIKNVIRLEQSLKESLKIFVYMEEGMENHDPSNHAG